MQITNNGGWSAAVDHFGKGGKYLDSAPAPVLGLLNEQRIDVFWKDRDGSLVQFASNDGSTWYRAVNLGAHGGINLDGAPAPVVGFSPGRIDVFWRVANSEPKR
jgi:hypothetical protein